MIRASLFLLVIATALTGCAMIHGKAAVQEHEAKLDRHGKMFNYPNLGTRLDVLKRSSVRANCIEENKSRNDQGEVITATHTIIGCHWSEYEGDSIQDRIVVERSCEGAKAIPHELAHQDNSLDDKNIDDAFDWPEDEEAP